MSDMIRERMNRIGSKRSFQVESQAKAQEGEEGELLWIEQKNEGGSMIITLVLEPGKYNELSSETRLSFDEFVDVMNNIIEQEEDDWESLRMKDQVAMTRDGIVEATIIKHAKEVRNINTESHSGKQLSYLKRYDDKGNYIGDAIVVSLTTIPEMMMTIK